AVSTVAQIDLVDVQFENLTLAELALDLQCEQNLVEFAREHAMAGQEEVLRDLHGDGAAAGLNLPGTDQLRGCAYEAGGVDAVVMEEIIVLCCQNGINETLRNLLEADRQATHLAEF